MKRLSNIRKLMYTLQLIFVYGLIATAYPAFGSISDDTTVTADYDRTPLITVFEGEIDSISTRTQRLESLLDLLHTQHLIAYAYSDDPDLSDKDSKVSYHLNSVSKSILFDDENDAHEEVTVTIQFGPDEKLLEALFGQERIKSTNWLELDEHAQKLYPNQHVSFVTEDGNFQRLMPRSVIGVMLRTIENTQLDRPHTDTSFVVEVTEVFPGLPASISGVQPHDIILSCNGIQPQTHEQLIDILRGYAPYDVLNMVILRNNREVEFAITTAAYTPERLNHLRNDQMLDIQRVNLMPHKQITLDDLKIPGLDQYELETITSNLSRLPEIEDFIMVLGDEAESDERQQWMTVKGLGFSQFDQTQSNTNIRHSNADLERRIDVISSRLDRIEQILELILLEKFETRDAFIDMRIQRLSDPEDDDAQQLELFINKE